MMSTEGPS